MNHLKNQLNLYLDKVLNMLQKLNFKQYLILGLGLFMIVVMFSSVKLNNKNSQRQSIMIKTDLSNSSEVNTESSITDSKLVLESPNYISPYDSISNIRILSLNCTEKDFIERQSFNTGYTDLSKTSFKKKKIVFKVGYANTDYYASKYIAKAVVKTFRDFPCLDNITIILPMGNYTKKCIITKEQAAVYFELNFEKVRQNIVVFRKEFLENSRYDRAFIEAFDNEYIKTINR